MGLPSGMSLAASSLGVAAAVHLLLGKEYDPDQLRSCGAASLV